MKKNNTKLPQYNKGVESLTDNAGLQKIDNNSYKEDILLSDIIGKQLKEANEQVEKIRQDIEKELIEQGRKKGLVQGIALCINLMYRGEDERSIWKACGMSVDECIENQVDEYDMETILKHEEELKS